MHITPGARPARRDDTAEPVVRPRGVPLAPALAPDREVARLAVDDSDHLPFPPPVTSSLDDATIVVSTTTVDVVTDVVTPAVRDRDWESRRGPARLESPGFLESHGAHSRGWIASQLERSDGWLHAQLARRAGWLDSLDARRRAAGNLGWVAAQERRVMDARAARSIDGLHRPHDMSYAPMRER